MKLLLLISALVCFANALKREQDFEATESELSTSTQTTAAEFPVTSQRSNATDDDDDDSGDFFHSTQCSTFLCSAMCRGYGCQESVCLPSKRCGCLCARQLSARDYIPSFFSRGYISHFTPHIHAFPQLLGLMPRFEDRFRDISKLLESLGNNEGWVSRVYYTKEYSCETAADCASSCANCTTVNCLDNLCQCASCASDASAELADRPDQTCLSARDCEETCKGCSKIGCRFRNCECARCTDEEATTVSEPTEPSTDETTSRDASTAASSDASTAASSDASTDASTAASSDASTDASTATPTTTTVTTTTAHAAADASTVSIEIVSSRSSNQTIAEGAADGKCLPKICNDSCWQKQCTKWSCVDDVCQCAVCPDDMAIVVRDPDGKSAKPEDSDKYQIIL